MTGPPDSTSGRLKVGIIGAGSMGSVHATGWQQTGADIVGIHAPGSRRAAGLADSVGAAVFEELDDLLTEVDVLDICAPTHRHFDQISAAAAAGRHVICEKPLALSTAEATEAQRVCQAAGVRLLVAHVVRFFPEYVTARQRARAGDIGEVAVIRLNRLGYQPGGDQDWFRDVKKSGGVVFDLMIHDFDFARWLSGDITTVYAKSVRTGHPDMADHVLAILEHESGALTHVQGSWALPPPTFRTAFEIAGSGGLITFDSEQQAPLRYSRSVTEVADVPAPGSPLAESPWTTELRHFADVLSGRAEALVTAEDAVAAVRIAEAAAESITSGEPVVLSGASS